mmetsp:Transcript_46416/g.100829  ORF Transcript_46416/g.100829 Transcript_46416/m.100829 type:complete len:234 (-) Transcript_46416:42-743(-)
MLRARVRCGSRWSTLRPTPAQRSSRCRHSSRRMSGCSCTRQRRRSGSRTSREATEPNARSRCTSLRRAAAARPSAALRTLKLREMRLKSVWACLPPTEGERDVLRSLKTVWQRLRPRQLRQRVGRRWRHLRRSALHKLSVSASSSSSSSINSHRRRRSPTLRGLLPPERLPLLRGARANCETTSGGSSRRTLLTSRRRGWSRTPQLPGPSSWRVAAPRLRRSRPTRAPKLRPS